MRLNSKQFIDGLCDLCKELPNIETMIEVGTYAGESTMIFKTHLNPKTIYCVDAWQQNEKYRDNQIFDAEFIFDNVVKSDNIVKIKSLSNNQDVKNIITEKVDFVYIDASHRYEDVLNDINFYLPLVKKGGYIGGHDFSEKFKGVQQAVREGFNIFEIYKDTSWLVKL
jgi:predicted O-methyltransferase YrrM